MQLSLSHVPRGCCGVWRSGIANVCAVIGKESVVLLLTKPLIAVYRDIISISRS